MTLTFNEYLEAFCQADNNAALSGIGRGIEREALRVLSEGKLSEQPHYNALGSALTHPTITTDYSETLLEFISPVSQSAKESIAQLQDIQKYTFSNIDNELLWPMSMPCFVEDDNKIELAKYGQSNIGKMKTVYRQGLKNRYGSMMQVIAGIHFNFSFSSAFWETLKKLDNDDSPLDDYISKRYFALLRNYKKYSWLIPYLYGSSPSICPSFLQDKPHQLPFKKTAKGSLYLEHATSLRMSDLGYTNSEQSSLSICYNNVDDYVAAVQKAINLPSAKFAEIGVKVDGQYQQLNSNVLQIENELYAPIRPKRVAKSGEKPSEALKERGVEYVEVRALDVNPFSDTGISLGQVQFLDVFLTFCVLIDTAELDCETQKSFEKNMDEVVIRGRDPELELFDGNNPKLLKEWGSEIFEQLTKVALLLDTAYETNEYSIAITNEHEKIIDSSKTPSAQLIEIITTEGKSLSTFALEQAEGFREKTLARPYQFYDEAHFVNMQRSSFADQANIETEDKVTFDQFIADYFEK